MPSVKENNRKFRTEYPDYAKEWRRKRKEEGKCSRCSRKSAKNKTLCRKCLNKSNEYGKAHPSTMQDIRPEDYEKIKKEKLKKNKKCSICKSTKHQGRGWCIDHDHKTKKFRGLLCSFCNFGLGLFKDKEDLLLRAIEYLRKNNEQR